MQQNLNDIVSLYPDNPNFGLLKSSKAFNPFSDIVIDFLNQLSKKILINNAAKRFPDVITFAFWCRKANIQRLKAIYHDNHVRLGRGVVFHITPSNVPINFAYSLVAGLLAGNINVVRVPSKAFEQTQIVCDEIARLLKSDKYIYLSEKIYLIKYEKQSTATEYFSSLCDVRIIWGGDSSISQIRQCALPARAFDVTFADRYSFCVINADSYINDKNTYNIANLFYNDTFLYDQNACSAPHLIVWLGDKQNIIKSKTIFWSSLHSVVKERYKLEDVVVTDKLTAMCRQAIEYDNIRIVDRQDNYIIRVELDNLQSNISDYRSYGGYFCEFSAQNLNEIETIINRKYQTLSYYGLSHEQLKDFKLKNEIIGIDRIVPIGQTTTFSLTWDGYILPHVLSSICNIM